MASYIPKYILRKETGQDNLLKGIEDESAKQEASTDMKLKNLPKYLKKQRKSQMQEIIFCLFGYSICLSSRIHSNSNP